jgi:integrase
MDEQKEYRGTAQPFKDAKGRRYWRARATLADGHRVWLEPRFYGKHGKQRARELADEKTREACEKGLTLRDFGATREGAAGETCDDYFQRLSEAREAEGISGVRKDRYTWGKWITPRLGPRPVAEVTRDEIEDVRNALDAEVKKYLATERAEGISGKTAANIWSVVRTTFKEAVSARDRALRVRTDDPSSGHKPPLETPERAKTFLYPVEVAKLLACKDVPQTWRDAYAVAIYLYVRPEELEALTWLDVDFAAGTVSVSKAIEARSGKPKPLPKNANAVRPVPIEPALMPLLKAMHEARASDDAPVVPALRELNDKFRAKLLREHLELADVKRPRLREDTLTLRPIDFRSCRDTGITWLALSGLSLHAIQRRCGHEDIDTTNGYVKMAEDLSGTIGQPFPPLPAALLRRREPLPKARLSDADRAENKCRRRESNPRPSAYETPALTV